MLAGAVGGVLGAGAMTALRALSSRLGDTRDSPPRQISRRSIGGPHANRFELAPRATIRRAALVHLVTAVSFGSVYGATTSRTGRGWRPRSVAFGTILYVLNIGLLGPTLRVMPAV